MSLVGKIRSMLPTSSGMQHRFGKTPLVEKLVPDEHQQEHPVSSALVRHMATWQYTFPDFYQQQQVSLVQGIQETYQHVYRPAAHLRARRARRWLRADSASQSKQSSLGLTEQEVNRNLMISASVIGVDLLGSLIFPPLSVLTVPLILFSSYSLFKIAWLHLVRYHKPNVGFMVCLTILASIATGYYGLAILTALVNQLAFKLQFRIRDDSQHRLVNVFKQQPHFVYTLINGVELRVPFASIQRGDIVIVHTGETIPVDGIITTGSASVDQHLLTGESQPVEKGPGDDVFAATVVLTGWLHIQAERASEETMVAQIGQILNKTISDKTDMQLRADMMANRTVTPTLLLSLAVLPFLGPMASAGIIAAHFGMRMSIVAPLVVLNYFRLLSHHQILVKDGRTFDLLHDIDTVVFDKTGTLTIHQPHVRHIYTWNSASEADVLAWAAAAEQKQGHPIALAIIEAAETRQIPIPRITEVAYSVGYGLTVSIGDQQIKVGSQRFMQQAAISIVPEVYAVEEQAHQQGHSLVLVACNNRIVGAIELEPTLRPEAQHVIAGLRQRGIKHIAIISGDRDAPTRKLAHDLGVDQYFAETLPQNKAEIIDQLQEKGHSVCFVGDGINDAIALKKAHVSVSMRGASTVATDTAQVVLLDEGLEHLCQLFDFASDFDRTMKTCFALVITPSIIGMGGVFVLGYGLPQAIWFKQISLVLGASGAMEPLVRLTLKPRRTAPVALPARPALPVEQPDQSADESTMQPQSENVMQQNLYNHMDGGKKNGVRVGVLALVLLMVMFLAACGNQPAAPAPDNQAGDTGNGTSDDTLHFGFENRFLTWDPHQEQRPVALMGYQLVYDALLAEDAEGNLKAGLAVEWEQSVDSIELTLREGVLFHDGTPFDAEVAKANLLRARDEGAPPIAQQLMHVEAIDVLDDTHIRLNLSEPVPDLLNNLARSTGMMISPDAFDTAAELPIGTGPWTFNEAESEVDVQYVFDRFPDFWDADQQGLEQVVLLILPDSAARLNALRSGEVDAAGFIAAEDIASLEGEGFTLVTNEAVHLGLHIMDREGEMVPEFADEQVRRALNHAIDRETLVDVVTSGYGEPMTQRFHAGQYGYAEDMADLTYDPEQARELLAEADAENLEFAIPIAGQPGNELQAIAGYLQDVGVTMNIESIAPGTLIQESAAGNWAAAILPINEPHVATYIANRVQVGGFLNPFDVEEPDLEELAAEARQLPPDEAEPLWSELTRETAERGIIIHLYAIPSIVFTSPQVQGGEVGYLQPNVLRLRSVTLED